MSSDLAVLVAPLALGALTSGNEYASGLLVSAAVTVVGLLFVLAMPETHRVRRPADEPSAP